MLAAVDPFALIGGDDNRIRSERYISVRRGEVTQEFITDASGFAFRL